MRDNIEQSVK